MTDKQAKRWPVFFALTGLFSIYACEESLPLGVYDDIVDSTSVGRLELATIDIQPIYSVARREINTGRSLSLFLGQAGNKEALILMKFDDLPEPDSFQVSLAKLRLAATDVTGLSESDSFKAKIYAVSKEWEETEVTYDSISVGGFFDLQPIGEFTIVPQDTQSLESNVEFEIVQKWISGEMENYGFLIKAESPSFLQRYSSSNTSADRPVMTLYQENDDGGRDSLVLIADEDATIFSETSALDPGPMYVGNGIEHRSLFGFDVSSIPQEATILRAVLTFHIDHDRSFLDDGNAAGFNVLSLLKEVTGPLAVSEDPDTTIGNAFSFTTSGLGAVDTSQALTITMRSVVQSWIDGRAENIGLAIVPLSPTSNPYLTAIHTAATDPLKAPKLDIHYSTPPLIEKEKRNDQK